MPAEIDFHKEILLEDERAALRPLTPMDIDALLPVATNDNKLLQFSPKPVHSPELLHDYIQSALNEKQKGERYPFIIFDKQANAFAGSTSYLAITPFHSRLEIGATWIGKQFQRTGLNRHCKFLMLNYVFETLNWERVEFKTDERNTQSRNAIEAIGGKLEGILRNHTLMSDGFRRNTVCYSILKNEWPEIKQRVFEKAN